MKQSGVIDLFVIKGLLENAYWSEVITELWSVVSTLPLLSLRMPCLPATAENFLEALAPVAFACFSLCLGSWI